MSLSLSLCLQLRYSYWYLNVDQSKTSFMSDLTGNEVSPRMVGRNQFFTMGLEDELILNWDAGHPLAWANMRVRGLET